MRKMNLESIVQQYHPDLIRMCTDLDIPIDLATIEDSAIWDRISSYPLIPSIVLENFSAKLNPNILIQCQSDLTKEQFLQFAKSTDFHCALDQDENIVLVYYSGIEEVVTIPKAITRLATGCFKNNDVVKKVIIHSGISNIPNDYAIECKHLNKTSWIDRILGRFKH